MTLPSPPKVLVNSLMKIGDKIHIEEISKVFIITETVFGLNRLNLVEESNFSTQIRVYVICYCIMVNLLVVLSTIYQYVTDDDGIFIFVTEFSYLVCCVLSYGSASRLRHYFQELNKFDRYVGCHFNIVRFCYQNVLLNTIIFLLTIAIVIEHVRRLCGTTMNNRWHFIPVLWVHILEVYFFGYLFYSIVARIRLVNYFMGSCPLELQSRSVKRFKFFLFNPLSEIDYSEMKFLMDLYETLITAHHNLVDAIKWQYLVILTTSFLTSLGVANRAAWIIVQKHEKNAEPLDSWTVASILSYTVGYTMAQFLCCIHQDQLKSEVERLRKLLASRLYKDTMDKTSRSVARALMMLTEQRDLSFSLFGMFRVDTSLPLHYIALFVSYLIILLQFEKVVGATV